MRYKVGDIVRVRDDIRRRNRYDNDSPEDGGNMLFTSDMEALCGRYVEIEAITSCSFMNGLFYKIKGAPYFWTDQMFDEDLDNFYFDPVECSIESLLF